MSALSHQQKKITFAEMRARLPTEAKTSGPSPGGFRLTSALRFLLLFLSFRLLGRFLCGFLG
jgi:hypothetical protein